MYMCVYVYIHILYVYVHFIYITFHHVFLLYARRTKVVITKEDENEFSFDVDGQN